MPSVLLIEDDTRLAPLIARHLGDSGFALRWASDGAAAWEALAAAVPDLIVLDVMLPGEDGFSLCRRLRAAHPVIGIVMVTARGLECDRIHGLQLGADDYLPKPFSLWELEARLNAVHRRTALARTPPPARREIAGLCLDLERRELHVHGRPVELTRSEFELLARLSAEPGLVFTRDRLLEGLQRDGDALDRTIDTHISNLRRKIGDDPRSPRHLKTVWGVGYRFSVA
jgi:two-component system phosphate regulon response regulator OmpR